ncbi:MAG: polyvinylalcohol dehydrogenase [Armatimonadetes bacterium CG17_big_fil_post_rev_8_21_14_2_50_66_6]|nr:PQQ-binding-like beta-propeller repeat protein [Armatimonadota bacterium]NCO93936.1 PQQ-binding-like beta-propeller repeat protein [Armatimonadota bacterium]NCP31835.1 PQQ-binding-like beta-propeller repeat protein [Armatimonadota bacterium]NDK14650.1 PQQ-binding-like beta-propeller repeat protein [Armatimonadota bacterium]PIW13508.1 MAG: polyvinylalcohol dehydrogenase [Armatimonadetes bacterium CG17_big_fil_post_rev_8_21_14_2_50_66_6]
MRLHSATRALPLLAACAGAIALATWWTSSRPREVTLRAPGADKRPKGEAAGPRLPQMHGTLTAGEGVPADLPGVWPQFRGPRLNAVSEEEVALARKWPAAGPPVLWNLDLGEGFAGPAIHHGCVYLIDYDREHEADVIRCLSLADGRDVWRFSYPVKVKRNHGMSRTIPAVNDDVVVTMGPKCHVTCLDAKTGTLRWALDLVGQFGTTVPQWYAGQCPLLEKDRAILAPGGSKLMIAVDLATGKTLWETPNAKGWAMTHSSITPMEVAGQRTYVYCAKRGVVGVSATDGKLLWDTDVWKIGIATVPSPVVVGDDRVFLSGGYGAGSLMLKVAAAGGSFSVTPAFRLKAAVFGATQQTPVPYEHHLFGVRPNGEMVCLDLNGKVVWASGPKYAFGMGPFMIADGLLLAMDDSGLLTTMEATPGAFRPLARAQVLKGHDSWAPMALAGGRLLVRDMTRMVCLDLRGQR